MTRTKEDQMFYRNRRVVHLWVAAVVVCMALPAAWALLAGAAEKGDAAEPAAKEKEAANEAEAAEAPPATEDTPAAGAPPAAEASHAGDKPDSPAAAEAQPAATPDSPAAAEAQPAATPDSPAAAEAQPAATPEQKKPDALPAKQGEPDSGIRNPFEVGAKLLREVKASQAEAKQPAAPPKPQPALPIIKMTGVMIVGDNKMAIADIDQYGIITVLKGETFALQLRNRPEPFKFTVSEIQERQLVIVTDQGTEIRALFK